MSSSFVFVALTVFAGSVFAQLPLPNPPWLPPDATYGTQPSSNSISNASTNPHWAALLGDTLWFYEAQRSGKLPNTNRVSWRNDSALNDGQDVGLDLSGGYYDAGDYVKYTFPLSFSLMSICWGAMDFGHGYNLASQTPYLDDMLRWGLDWLIKAHPSPNTLYVQVGDADLDSAYWGGDQGIPTPRHSFPINETSPGTDAAAQASAAFAVCSALYANITLSATSTPPASLGNTTYAATLLNHAQQLYAFATNTTQRQYQKSVPSVGQAYASSGYTDELVIAGLFLALAANSSDAFAHAAQNYVQGELARQMIPGDDQVFNWDAKTPGAVVLAAQIAALHPQLVTGNASNVNWKSDAEGYLDGIVNGNSRGHLTSGGLLYYAGDSDDASLNPALNAAMLLTRFASAGLASTEDKRTRYLSFAQDQLDYVLGKNPMTVPYIVGVHPNSPQNPHSAISTGASPSDISSLDTVPAQERYVLYGGLVGGPDARDRFWDLRSDWAQGEVALDYNAPLISLVAASILNAHTATTSNSNNNNANNANSGGTVDPWYIKVQAGSYDVVKPKGFPCDAAVQSGCAHGGLSEGGKIAVGVVVGVVGAVLVGLGVWWIVLLKRRVKKF